MDENEVKMSNRMKWSEIQVHVKVEQTNDNLLSCTAKSIKQKHLAFEAADCRIETGMLKPQACRLRGELPLVLWKHLLH